MEAKVTGLALIITHFEDRGYAVLLRERKKDGFWDLPGGTVGENSTPRNALTKGTFREIGLRVVPHYQVGEDYIVSTGDGEVTIFQAFFCVVLDGELTQNTEETGQTLFFTKEEIDSPNGPKLLDLETTECPDGIIRDILRNALDTMEEVSFYFDDEGEEGISTPLAEGSKPFSLGKYSQN